MAKKAIENVTKSPLSGGLSKAANCSSSMHSSKESRKVPVHLHSCCYLYCLCLVSRGDYITSDGRGAFLLKGDAIYENDAATAAWFPEEEALTIVFSPSSSLWLSGHGC